MRPKNVRKWACVVSQSCGSPAVPLPVDLGRDRSNQIEVTTKDRVKRVKCPMVSLKEIFCRVQAVAPRVSREPLVGARYAPEASALPTQCFSNAERKAQQAGGEVLYGWMFHFRQVLALPGRYYLVAVNHTVWCAPDKTLIDVTPFHSDPKHNPIVVNGDAVLFLVDSDATPLKNGEVALALPSWFFPLTTGDDALAAYVAKLASEELVEWEKQVSEAEGFKGSQRATDLLRSRRRGA
jgi:hypothetical protein